MFLVGPPRKSIEGWKPHSILPLETYAMSMAESHASLMSCGKVLVASQLTQSTSFSASIVMVSLIVYAIKVVNTKANWKRRVEICIMNRRGRSSYLICKKGKKRIQKAADWCSHKGATAQHTTLGGLRRSRKVHEEGLIRAAPEVNHHDRDTLAIIVGFVLRPRRNSCAKTYKGKG